MNKIAEAEKLIRYLKDNWKGDKGLVFENVDIDLSEDGKEILVKGKKVKREDEAYGVTKPINLDDYFDYTRWPEGRF